MSQYDDSFEAETTSSVEDAAAAPDSSSPSSSDLASTQNTKSDGAAVAESSNTTVFLSSPPAITPVPGIGPVPTPVPVPIPITAVEKAKEETQAHDERSERSSSPSSSFPLPISRSRGGAITSFPPTDVGVGGERKADASSAQSDNAAWGRSSMESTGKLSSSDSAGLPREIAERAAHAGDGAEFQALSRFVAFGSERGSTAAATTSFTRPTSQRSSELQVPSAPSRVSREFVAFPSSEGESLLGREEEEEEKDEPARAELSAQSPTQVPSPAVQPAESPHKTPSETKSASVAPSSIFSTLSQHLQTTTPPPPPPQPTTTQQPTATATNVPSLSLPLVPSSTVTGAAVTAGLRPLTSISSGAASDAGNASLPQKAIDAAMPDATASAAPTAFTTTTAMPLPPLPSLPSLPPPGWVAPERSSSTSAAALPPVANTPSTETVRAQGWSMGGGGSSKAHYDTAPVERTTPLVAPLPPPPDYHRITAEETRVSELREASEAVERLVKAFALLKGYGALEEGRNGRETFAAAATKASISAATTTAHRAGAYSTIQARQVTRTRGLRVPTAQYDAAFLDSSSTAASPLSVATPLPAVRTVNRSREGERLAEELVLGCVLGLLQEHARQRSKTRGREGNAKEEEEDGGGVGALWRAARPHYEVIGADGFTGSVPRTRSAVAPTTAANPAASLGGVPGIDVPLFDPRDRQSATDLYNVVREALGKYVLRRVRTSDGSFPSTPTTSPLPVSHITATFAWALLLDMSAVCQEIARCAYDAAAASPSPVYPILVRFRGDAAGAEVARAAMHCLPFEVLTATTADISGGGSSSSSPFSTEPRGCLFRMACWVTQEQLWTVSDALLDTLREDVLKRAKAVQYASFSTAVPVDVDPRLLVPPQTPMLTVLPLPNCRGRPSTTPTASAEGRYSDNAVVYRRSTRNAAGASAAERDLFDVPAAALQKVAFSVSVLSTNILSSVSTDCMLADLRVENYADAAMAVSEAVGELLQDESIKAAVQRRATEKLKKAQIDKSKYVSATRQRKEQAIIDKAEKEAEEMVEHILQEMRAQGMS
jgi:hypothetical protein